MEHTSALIITGIHKARVRSSGLQTTSTSPMVAVERSTYPATDSRIRRVISPGSSAMAEECCEAPTAAYGSYDMDIEPDDIDASDTVTVVWEIQ